MAKLTGKNAKQDNNRKKKADRSHKQRSSGKHPTDHKKKADRSDVQRSRRSKKIKMVPKPNGRPGRSGPEGYNIRDAMGVSDVEYCYLTHFIRTLVIKYLDISHPLSRQADRLRVELVVAKAESMCPDLERYEGSWATRDIMAQYLRNRSTSDRKRAEGTKIRIDSSTTKRKRKERTLSDSESEDMDTRKRVKRSKSKRGDSTSRSSDDSDEESCNADSESDSHINTKKSSKRQHSLKRLRRVVESSSDSDSDDDNKETYHHAKQRKKVSRPSNISESKSSSSDDDDNKDRHHNIHQKKNAKTRLGLEEQVTSKQRKRTEKKSQKEPVTKKQTKKDQDAPKDTKSKMNHRGSKTKNNASGGIGETTTSELPEQDNVLEEIRRKRSKATGKASSDVKKAMTPEQNNALEELRRKRSKARGKAGSDVKKATTSERDNTSEELRQEHPRRKDGVSTSVEKATRPAPASPASQAQVEDTRKPGPTCELTTRIPSRSKTANDVEARPHDQHKNAPESKIRHDKSTEHRGRSEVDSDTNTVDEIRNADYHTDISDSEVMDGDRLCRCPECKEELPKIISPQLTFHLNSYCKLRRREGLWSTSVLRMGMEICNLLRREKAKDKHYERATRKGWPAASINFNLLPERILGMVGELNQLVFDKDYLENSFIWRAFGTALTDDGLSIKQLSTLAFGKISPWLQIVLRSKPGYYGMKGNTIISNMLLGLFPQQTTSNDAFYPLSHTHFLTFVLVPYIGTELIAEDLKCSLEEGYDHMIKSCRTGNILYPECNDDDEVDAICRKNIATFKLSRSKGKQRETRMEVDESTKAAVVALLEFKNQASQLKPLAATAQAARVANNLFPELKTSTSSTPMMSENGPGGDPTPQNAIPTEKPKQKKGKRTKANVETKEHHTRARSKTQVN